jgi:hypothetical protein
MLASTIFAVLSPEGWLDPEAHESDLRGSRGVAAAGVLLIFMGVANFRNTVRPGSGLAATAGHAGKVPQRLQAPRHHGRM